MSPMLRRLLLLAAVPVFLATLSACDQLGIESASVVAARVEADGKAVGAAGRHGGRAIEDCFALNKRTDKANIYAGWREMDDYMRENKIDAVAPELLPNGKPKPDQSASADADSSDGDADTDKSADTDKPAASAGGKLADKAAAKPAHDKAPKVARADKPANKPANKAPAKTAAADADKSAAPN